VRVLLDTNVLIAAFIARGVCHELLEHCVEHHTLVTSEFILSEFRTKLTSKFKYSVEDAAAAAQLLQSRMEISKPAGLLARVCRDADDDHVLAAALTGNCACIVTGDKDLLVLGQYQQLAILSPSSFLQYEEWNT